MISWFQEYKRLFLPLVHQGRFCICTNVEKKRIRKFCSNGRDTSKGRKQTVSIPLSVKSVMSALRILMLITSRRANDNFTFRVWLILISRCQKNINHEMKAVSSTVISGMTGNWIITRWVYWNAICIDIKIKKLNSRHLHLTNYKSESFSWKKYFFDLTILFCIDVLSVAIEIVCLWFR